MPTVNVNPNYDGYIDFEPFGTGGLDFFGRITTRPYLGISGNKILGIGKAERAFLDFDLSAYNSGGNTISSVVLWLYTAESVNNPNTSQIFGMSTLAQDESDDPTLYSNIKSGTLYADNLSLEGIGWNGVDLGVDAVSEANSQGFLSLGVSEINEDQNEGTAGAHYEKFFSMENEEAPPEDFYPYLVVTYTSGSTSNSLTSPVTTILHLNTRSITTIFRRSSAVSPSNSLIKVLVKNPISYSKNSSSVLSALSLLRIVVGSPSVIIRNSSAVSPAKVSIRTTIQSPSVFFNRNSSVFPTTKSIYVRINAPTVNIRNSSFVSTNIVSCRIIVNNPSVLIVGQPSFINRRIVGSSRIEKYINEQSARN